MEKPCSDYKGSPLGCKKNGLYGGGLLTEVNEIP